jgi:hypothetical protein
MAEAVTIIDTARRHGALLRLTGGLAVRRYTTDLDFMDRAFSDIDFLGLSSQAPDCGASSSSSATRRTTTSLRRPAGRSGSI